MGKPASASAETSQSRPFYAEHAALYDLLITDPVEPWVSAVHHRLAADGLAPAAILEAGCGTGRHAAALHDLGHQVTLLDASPALLRIAARACPAGPTLLADLCTLRTPDRFAAVTCRGVLNDLLTDHDRQAALTAMATSLDPHGVLFCDVRETTASRARADGRPRTRTAALPSGGSLAYTSTSTWSHDLIQVHEEHLVTDESTITTRSVYDFAMRPWTPQELQHCCQRAGLHQIRTAPGVGRSTGDRLFVTATRP